MATGKRRQTFEKMNRERKVREKRALKAEKREQRKLGTSVGEETTPADDSVDPTVDPTVDDPRAEDVA